MLVEISLTYEAINHASGSRGVGVGEVGSAWTSECAAPMVGVVVRHPRVLRDRHARDRVRAAGGFPEHVVRTVTENGRTLKFTSQGFESE